ncbi:GNAT family N-acetyltransferase [Clostridium weizhouense]|uniref:GNAT family N-acetyltransferase n=1 Tax=Clostridium weizhouense TaxID=2859781 RepID=A0ABS7AMV8_9CLOT|nr:GNAT family N-acetyltransferase [Clostridium weizhouense]MBW6409983.1 GNAT family N-acetyltransferase [Clostridium weizhouense]
MGILRINETDLNECASLFVRVFNGDPWNDKWSDESAFRRLKDIYMCPNFIGIKYVEKNIIKGAIFANCEEWYEGKHLNIKEVFVSNEVQGNNIGSILINSIEDEVKKVGVDFLILFTQNNLLKNFYIKNNFKEENSLSIMTKSI